jgi:predicted SAM-dependent methyltransferase
LNRILQAAVGPIVNSVVGRGFLNLVVTAYQYRLLSHRTVQAVRFDVCRSAARSRSKKLPKRPAADKLHVGCGARLVPGWLNVDVADADACIDLGCGKLPWSDGVFAVALSQHVIEHLELKSELLPLLHELCRVLRSGGELWLSCPDLEKACRSYEVSRGRELLDDRERRKAEHVDLGLAGIPSQHFINVLFQQDGEHKNLFDEELLCWALGKSGFVDCRRTIESELLSRFPEFPARGDDIQSLYVVAKRP